MPTAAKKEMNVNIDGCQNPSIKIRKNKKATTFRIRGNSFCEEYCTLVSMQDSCFKENKFSKTKIVNDGEGPLVYTKCFFYYNEFSRTTFNENKFVDSIVFHNSFSPETAFDGCVFLNTSFKFCSFKETEFKDCSFNNCSFENCEFEKVSFSSSNLGNIGISRCKFVDCTITGTDEINEPRVLKAILGRRYVEKGRAVTDTVAINNMHEVSTFAGFRLVGEEEDNEKPKMYGGGFRSIEQ